MVVLWVVIAVIVILAVLFIVSSILLGTIVAHRLKSPERMSEKQRTKSIDHYERKKSDALALKEKISERYAITDRDGLKLQGYLIRAKEPSDVYVFFCHGYHSPFGGFEVAEYADLWESMGYNLFFVDHRAHGKSEGKYLSFGQYEAQDCIQWIDFMKEQFGPDIQIILHGHSMGASTILIMSGMPELQENVKMVVADCGYTDFYHLSLHSLRVPRFLVVPLVQAANFFLTLFHHVDIHKSDANEAVKHSKVPTLFLHGEKDQVVPVEMSIQDHEACAAPDKALVLFPDTAHCKSYETDPVRYREAVAVFTDKYILQEGKGDDLPSMEGSA